MHLNLSLASLLLLGRAESRSHSLLADEFIEVLDLKRGLAR